MVVQDNGLCCFIRCKTHWTLAPNAWLRLVDLPELLGFKNTRNPWRYLIFKVHSFLPSLPLGCLRLQTASFFTAIHGVLLPTLAFIFSARASNENRKLQRPTPPQVLATQHASAAPGGLGSCALPRGSCSTEMISSTAPDGKGSFFNFKDHISLESAYLYNMQQTSWPQPLTAIH